MGSLARYLGFDPETAPWLREATAGEPFSFAILTLDQYGNALDTRDLAVYMEPEMLPPLLEGKWSLEADGPKTVFTIEPQESIPHDITVRLYDEGGNERTYITTQLRVGLSGASPDENAQPTHAHFGIIEGGWSKTVCTIKPATLGVSIGRG